MSRATDDGFSLIEGLVALAILAVAGIAIVGAAEEHIRRISDVERRAAAQLTAENHAAELAVGAARLDEMERTEKMLGMEWLVRHETANTSDPDLVRVTIAVHAGDDGVRYGRLISFVDIGVPR